VKINFLRQGFCTLQTYIHLLSKSYSGRFVGGQKQLLLEPLGK